MHHFDKEAVDYRIYVIIDEGWIGGRHLNRLVEAELSGGASVIQYRSKQGSSLHFYEQAVRDLRSAIL